MYKLLGLVFSCIVVGFNGQTPVTLNLDKMFLSVKDWSRAFTTQLVKVILFGLYVIVSTSHYNSFKKKVVLNGLKQTTFKGFSA